MNANLKIPLSLCLLLLCSCATIVNSSYTELHIASELDSTRICINNDTTRWAQTPVEVQMPRSARSLLITARNRNKQQFYLVPSKLSPAFIYGNLFSGGLIGYGIDLLNDKRFDYPENITLCYDSTHRYGFQKYKTHPLHQKHELNVKVSFPEGNAFYLSKSDGYGNRFGFLGISAGLEYYFSEKYNVSLTVGGMLDFMVPIPVPIELWDGDYESVVAEYGALQVGRDYRRFHLEAGLQLHSTLYRKWHGIDRSPSDTSSLYLNRDTLIHKTVQRSAGLALSAHYRVSDAFQIGLNYYPSFINMEDKKLNFHYSHMLFLEFILKFQVYHPKSRASHYLFMPSR
ncbi:MAG: hypothetical protein ACOYOT_12670 [Bacteroidales bacterium]